MHLTFNKDEVTLIFDVANYLLAVFKLSFREHFMILTGNQYCWEITNL